PAWPARCATPPRGRGRWRWRRWRGRWRGWVVSWCGCLRCGAERQRVELVEVEGGAEDVQAGRAQLELGPGDGEGVALQLEGRGEAGVDARPGLGESVLDVREARLGERERALGLLDRGEERLLPQRGALPGGLQPQARGLELRLGGREGVERLGGDRPRDADGESAADLRLGERAALRLVAEGDARLQSPGLERERERVVLAEVEAVAGLRHGQQRALGAARPE